MFHFLGRARGRSAVGRRGRSLTRLCRVIKRDGSCSSPLRWITGTGTASGKYLLRISLLRGNPPPANGIELHGNRDSWVIFPFVVRAGAAVVTEGRLAFRPPVLTPASPSPSVHPPGRSTPFLPSESQAAFRRAEPPSVLCLAFF